MTEAPAAGQVWSARDYAENADFVPALGADVLALLDPQPGERILDVGCGNGTLTARLVESGATVTGLEPDPDLAAATRARSIQVLSQDAHEPFGEATYDAVFSNAALHWMRNPERVIANAHRALRPGGRFVAEQGGFGNVASISVAISAALEARDLPIAEPWDFPSPMLQRKRLEAAGFTVVSVDLIPRPTPLPTGMEGWLKTFAGPFVGSLDPALADDVLADTTRRLAPLHDPEEGWVADYVRLRFHAIRP
ncbi:class I SAM-dependent methyltransferase [Aestuariibius sp. 2305UL40-4]|uniref:class I SAM-dependent methyltransferase n=1 Tax=Aestuariibius violaceus TaxID=3234132 RepID=UPI00345E2234